MRGGGVGEGEVVGSVVVSTVGVGEDVSLGEGVRVPVGVGGVGVVPVLVGADVGPPLGLAEVVPVGTPLVVGVLGVGVVEGLFRRWARTSARRSWWPRPV